MCQYNDYILQQMSRSRLEDARSQAKADHLIAEWRKAQSARRLQPALDPVDGPVIIKLSRNLIGRLLSRSAWAR